MCLGMLQGFVGGSLGVSPPRSEPRVSLSQQLAHPGSSGMALGQLWYNSLTCVAQRAHPLGLGMLGE